MPRANRCLPALLLSLACSADADVSPPAGSQCEGGKCDELVGEDEPLQHGCEGILFDRSGRDFLPARLAEDALVKHVYMDAADGCPVDAEGVMKVLQESDDDCTAGLQTRVITEQAQLSGSSKGSSYRTITSRTCGERPEFGLLFSMFGFADASGVPTGLKPTGKGFPDGLEVIAFDEANGVFNYYKEVGGKMGFFGSSTDYVTRGPGGPSLTSVRGCANCHTSGGLIMKELTAPWLHWEGDFDSPGVEALVDNRAAVMGEREDGPNLQFDIVQPGNIAWNEAKVDFMKEEATVEQMLRPLFCPSQVNIAAFNRKTRIGARFLVDRQLAALAGVSSSVTNVDVLAKDYDAYIAAIGQKVPGTDAADVVAPWSFIERSHEDIDYIAKLVAEKIIDKELVIDVLMVDFTRPVFSDDRCDLLSFAPDLAPSQRTAAQIRDGLLANLESAPDGSPAAQLRDHLQARKDDEPFDHAASIGAFMTACKDRASNDQFASSDEDLEDLLGVNEFHIDALKQRALHRKLVMIDGELDDANGSAQHPFTVFEFEDTLPADELDVTSSADPGNPLQVHPQARFSPLDCALVDAFLPVAKDAPAPEPEPAAGCPGACGEFVDGAACQCDADCSQFGNCCEGFAALCE